jgi:hypothetical protein
MGISPVSFVAGEDISDYIYHFVESAGSANDNKVNLADSGSATYSPLGVLQNDPESGEEASVILFGPTKVVFSAPGTQIKLGHWVTCDGSGHACYTAEASLAVGYALMTGDSSASCYGEIFFAPNMSWLTHMVVA